MDLDFSPVWAGWQDLAYGTLVTIEVTIGAIVLGCLIGLAVGLGRLNPRRRILFGLCTAYLSIVRGTPLLVQPSAPSRSHTARSPDRQPVRV